MNWADWTILAVIGVSTAISLKRGFVREALSLLVWVAAVFVALAFHDRLATLIGERIAAPSLRTLVAFGILFVLTLVLGAVLNGLVASLVRATGLTGTDRVLGMVFGLTRGALICLAVVVVAPMLLPVREDGWWQESRLIPHFSLLEDWARTHFGRLVEAVGNWVGR